MEVLLLLFIGLAIGTVEGWYLGHEGGKQRIRDVLHDNKRKIDRLKAEVTDADAAHNDTKKMLHEIQDRLTTATRASEELEQEIAALRTTLAEVRTPASRSRSASRLTRIKGIGNVTAGKLSDAGIGSIEDLARLDDQGMQALEARLNVRGKADLSGWRAAARAMMA